MKGADMEFTTSELLLAAEVSKRVRRIRDQRAAGLAPDEKQAIFSQPANPLIEQVYRELTDFATVIRQLEAGRTSQPKPPAAG